MLFKGQVMENGDDLKYTSEAIATEYMFFCDLNNVNIFVEDSNKEYIYETIFNRLIGKEYSIKKILGVGGKQQLKRYFEEFGSSNKNNPKIKNIYIADGDFDRYIHREDMIDSPNFIYLEAYNIENYLIDKNASEKFAKGKLKELDSKVEEKVDFDNWKELIVEQASRLFFYYCYMKKYYPEEKTVSRNPYHFIDQKSGFEIKGAFDKYKNYVLSLDQDAESKLEIIKREYYKENDNNFNIICGKFLFESLYCHIKSITKKSFSKEDFKWDLICNFDIDKLMFIKDKILNVMNS